MNNKNGSLHPREELTMLWYILTPFLVLCLAAVGLTMAETVAHFRKKAWRPTANTRFSGGMKTASPLERRSSFHLIEPEI
jgi:hypothetical protein